MVADLFQVHVPVPELILRGTLVYWLLFLIFRFVLRRDVGAVGIADILLLVIVADAAQNAMSGGYDTVSEGAILVATIVAWNWLLDFLSYHFEAVQRFASPAPLQLVRNGVPQWRNLRRQILRGDYRVTVDHDFAGVLAACADRSTTWINAQITDFQNLFDCHFTFPPRRRRGAH